MTEGSQTPTPSSGEVIGGRRRALVIANDTYDHGSLRQLRAPEADAKALKQVLGDSNIGGFEVSVVLNAAAHEVQSQVEDLFADSRPDDLLLLHFSGHGLKSDSGELFIAARNTRPDRLASTSVSADFVQRCMRTARARTIVLFLDCCYGGAFAQGVTVRSSGPVNVMESFPVGRLGGGRGRAVISASSAMEYAFEGNTLTADHEPTPSLFTSAVVQGLLTGEADRDEDGLISLGELYDYVYDRVREQNPKQTPGRDVEMSGEVYLARSRRRRLRAVPVPDAVAAALREPDPTYRRGAVAELRDRLGHPELGVALGAFETLQSVARSDVRSVSDDAAAIVASVSPRVQPEAIDFGTLEPGDRVAIERTLQVIGVPLARAVRVDADAPLVATVDGDTVVLTFAPTGTAYTGTVTVTAATGAVVVPVTASLRSARPEWLPHPAAGAAATVDTLPSVSQVAGRPNTDVHHNVSVEVPGETLVGRRIAATSSPTDSNGSAHPAPDDAVGDPASASPAPFTPASPDLTATEPQPDSSGHPTLLPALGRVVVGSGLLVLASVVVPWFAEDKAASFQPSDVVARFILGALFLATGSALVSGRVDDAVAVGLAGAAAAIAIPALILLFRIDEDGKWLTPGVGWYAAATAGVLVVFSCALAVILLTRRVALSVARISWRDPGTLGVFGATIVAVVLFVQDAGYLRSEGSMSRTYVGSLWVLVAVGLPLMGLLGMAVRPRVAGRALLAGWAVGLLWLAIPEWILRLNRGWTISVIPFLALTGVLLLVAALFVGRGERTRA